MGVSDDLIEQPDDIHAVDDDSADDVNPFERDPDDPDTADAADVRHQLSDDDTRVSGPLG
jgi:hypothetical protein